MERVILFDGVCNLCNRFVKLVLKKDKRRKFKFSTLDSAYSKEIERRHQINLLVLDTVVLIENGRILTQSSAVLRIARHLGFPVNLLAAFYVFPRFARDFTYRIIARKRYGIFGKRNSCMVPSPDVTDRFIP